MNVSRRSFIGGVLATSAGCVCGKGAMPRHRSDYDGVQVGAITYSFRTMKLVKDCTLQHTLDAKLGSIELMASDLERDLGVPYGDQMFWRLSNEQKAEVIAWRKAVDPESYRAIAERYRAAGIRVHTVKFDQIGTAGMSDWETDYSFRTAKVMGARAITREVPDVKNFEAFRPQAARLAKYTSKYGINIAFHNHLQINATTYDGALLDMCPEFRINFDIGHYVAANDDCPLAFVKKYHDRISSIHLKDRTRKAHGQKNLAFGQGDTPLKDLFALLVKEGWDIPCDIELEYPIPEGSDAVREVGACNAFCRNAIIA